MLSCSEAKQKLEELKLLRDHLASELVVAKNSNSSEKEKSQARARLIKLELETKIKNMREQTGLEITVPNASNPYKEAMLEAGFDLSHSLCAEQTEIKINFEELIKKQTARYVEQNLREWAQDIEENKEELFDTLLDFDEQAKIKERIKFGMIPLIMPSPQVQLCNWNHALTNLKPVWIQNGQQQEINDPFIYEEKNEQGKEIGFSSIMNSSFSPYSQLQSRPYVVWVKPTQQLNTETGMWKTTNLKFTDQQKRLTKLHKIFPDLVEKIDMLPTEYAAMQSVCTNYIKEQSQKNHIPIQELLPFDSWDTSSSYIRFISLDIYGHHDVSRAYFIPDHGQLFFDGGFTGVHVNIGFRPVARS